MKKSDLVTVALAIFLLSKKAEFEQDASTVEAPDLDELDKPNCDEKINSDKENR